MKGLAEAALKYYRNGYNCSQCIIMAYFEIYKRKINPDIINMCGAVNNGFGTGCICSVLVAAIMIFGLIFDEKKARKKRILLFDRFMQKYNCLNCAAISAEKCDDIIIYVCRITEELIDED